MKFMILATLVALALAAPRPDKPAQTYGAPEESDEHIEILRDDREQDEDGNFAFEFETGNGIVFSKSGSSDGPDDSVVMSGRYYYTAPDGTSVEVTFVADENGYQPQSDLLPVAPEFPHEIPQFVLDQIAFAAEEDARRAEEPEEGPSQSYGAPQ